MSEQNVYLQKGERWTETFDAVFLSTLTFSAGNLNKFSSFKETKWGQSIL